MSNLALQREPRSFPLTPAAWGVTLAVVLAIGEGAGALAASQGAADVAWVLRTLGRMAALAWLAYGLWRWRDVPVVKRFALYFIGTLAAAGAWTLATSTGATQVARAILGMYALTALFTIGLAAVRLILAPSLAFCGVARTLIDEAIRMKIALVFIGGLLVLMPFLPFVLDTSDFLNYRLQSFLTLSLTLTAFLLGLMTIFLSVLTITSDLRTKRIYLTMTKPVGAASYLFGKWLGIVLLNALLIAVFGGATYVLTMMLAAPAETMSPNNPERVAVYERVLVARRAINPDLPDQQSWQKLIDDRIAELRQQDPGQYQTIDAKTLKNIHEELMGQWYRVSPREMRSYVFHGLKPARETDKTVQLRMTPRIGGDTGDGKVQLNLIVEGRPLPSSRLSDRTAHIINIPTHMIQEDGTLTLMIHNPQQMTPQGPADQPTVSFDAKDGLQMLFRAGGFTPNLIRGLVIIWISTAFLAMVGLTTGTILSFPVACVFCLMVYLAAIGSGFIGESMHFYTANPRGDLTTWQTILWYPTAFYDKFSQGEIFDSLKIVIKLVGQGFMLLTPDFSGFNPIPLINDGLLVSWTMLARAVLWVGVISTGLVGVIGYALFRRKELAQVIV